MRSFGLEGICQELATVTELARHHQVPFELSNLIRRTYQQALARYQQTASSWPWHCSKNKPTLTCAPSLPEGPRAATDQSL